MLPVLTSQITTDTRKTSDIRISHLYAGQVPIRGYLPRICVSSMSGLVEAVTG